jgi:mannose-6-phosphate isomerase-like protein (cupin superfamily)
MTIYPTRDPATAGDEVIDLGISTVIVRVPGEATGGAYAILEYIGGPGAGAGLHVHHRELEAFFILDGAMTFHLGDERTRATPGTWVAIPPETVHAFVNAEAEPVRTVILLRPAGLEGFFRDMATLLRQSPTGPDGAAVIALGKKYGVDFDLPQAAL